MNKEKQIARKNNIELLDKYLETYDEIILKELNKVLKVGGFTEDNLKILNIFINGKLHLKKEYYK